MNFTRSGVAGLALAAMVAFVTVTLTAPTAQAAPVVDQEQTLQNGCGNSTAAQTFTAGRSGELDRVELLVNGSGAPTGPVTVQIRPVDSGGGPTTTVLAQDTFPALDAVGGPKWVTASFGSGPTVLAGTKYAIVVNYAAPAGGLVFWCSQVPGTYAGGSALNGAGDPPTTFVPTTADYGFRTWVDALEFAVDPTSHGFGSQTVGTVTPFAKTFTASNPGTVPLTISGVAVTGANAGQFLENNDLCSGTTLQPNQSCTVQVNFVPTSAGAKAAALTFTHNAATGSPTNVALTGTGTAAPAPGPDPGPGPAPSPGPSPTPSYQCAGEVATIVGTRGADVLRGTAGSDVIVGRAGNDRIAGLGDDDVVCGSGGDDWIHGGGGDDTLKGGAGDDRIIGGAGSDRLVGGPGDDRVRQ